MHNVFMKLASVATALVATLSFGAEWPKFLGPNGDGTIDASDWNQDWSKKQPHELWKAQVGIGCASVAIANGRAITVGQKEAGKDTVSCFDPVTGKLLWEYTYEQKLEPAFYSGGPSATPAIDSGRVYIIAKDGSLFCIGITNGKVLWQKNLVSDFGGEKQQWGYAASPLIVDDLLIVEPGGKDASVAALKKDTGALVWKAGSDRAAYATPVRFKTETVNGLACFNQSGLVGYDLGGHELFRQPWKTEYDVNASAPLHKDGRFLIASSYGNGAALVKALPAPVEIVWKNKDLQMQFQNMVLDYDTVFAVTGDNSSRATLRCIDFATGKIRWEEKLRENRGNIIYSNGKLLVLSESGELFLLDPDREKYSERGRIQANRKPCWAPPSFANGLFYTRNNDGVLTCVDLR